MAHPHLIQIAQALDDVSYSIDNCGYKEYLKSIAESLERIADKIAPKEDDEDTQSSTDANLDDIEWF